MAKIKAYQFLEYPKVNGERGITGWIDVEGPTCDDFGALLRPVAVAICTSDVHQIRNIKPAKLPVQLGHETVGEVLKVGKYVKSFKPGDRVVIGCAQPNWGTPESYAYPPKLARPDVTKGNKAVRTWVERFAVENADMNLGLVPEAVSSLKAVMVPDMMGTAFGGVEAADIRFRDSVSVIGIGPVGLMAVAGCAIRGAGKIYAVGHREVCKDIALQYGATHIINYTECDDIYEETLKANGGRVDAVIVAGGEDNSFIGRALKCTKNGGHIVNVAAFNDRSKDFLIPSSEYMFGVWDTIIKGVVGGGRHFVERLLSLVENNRIDPSLAVTHVLHGFDAIPEALAIMEDKTNGKMIKSVVLLDE